MLKELLYLVIRDEARHGTFGVNYLRQQYRGEDGSRYGGVYWSRSFGARLFTIHEPSSAWFCSRYCTPRR